MKKLSMLLLLIALSLTPIRAQTSPASANLTASDSGACTTAGACLTVNIGQNAASSVIELTGTWSATVQFEGSNTNGGTFVAVNAFPLNSSTAVTSATANGAWRVTVSGLAQIRVRVSAFTSGTVAAAITLSQGPSANGLGGGGGGGSGTVTSVGLTTPAWLTVAGSPVTTSGTFAVTPTTAQTSHQVIGTCGAGTTFAPCALVAGDIPTAIPIANIGSAGLSGTSPIAIASTGAISCPTCNTSSSNVTSVFTRTGAVTATSGDYTLDQIGDPAAQKTFNLGTNNPIAFSSAGVFTNSAQNEYLQSILTGGSSCPQATIINSAGAVKVTDAVSGCVNTPSSGITANFSDAVAGYAKANAASAEVVGLYGATLCAANSAKCIGVAPQASSTVGPTGVLLEGIEVGVVPFNTTDTGWGILLSFEGGNSQPTADNMPAVDIQAPSGSGTWTSGFKCENGSISSTATELLGCVNIGAQASGVNQNSQFVFFNANNGSGIHTNINLNQDNVMALGGRSWSIVNPSTDESFAVALTATAALPINTLVKIDTAHADSIVICTTADTVCSGFVAGTNNASGMCVVSSTTCPIVSTPGSKVNGILGTGTCAIGNWVIVDTTTNGRVKCATAQPATWVGFALSTQSSVGSTLDVLFSPGGGAVVNAGTGFEVNGGAGNNHVLRGNGTNFVDGALQTGDLPAQIKGTTFASNTNCSAVGTAASPSVAACGSAAAGQFSCATNASTATCTVNTTAVTANSEIFVLESDTTVTGTRLGVTCNTSTTVNPATRLLASSVAATSFTINLGTVTTNPACFSYFIIN